MDTQTGTTREKLGRECFELSLYSCFLLIAVLASVDDRYTDLQARMISFLCRNAAV